MSMTPASAEYFARVAGDWDSIRTGYFTTSVRDAALRKAYLRPEMVVADVGSGTGFMAAGLAPLVEEVFALDGSEEMLAVARQNLAGLENVVYRAGDGAALPLDDASVDAVFANMYLHHCLDPLAALREMVRVLRPGGRLVLTDMDAHANDWFRAEMADVWLGFERAQVKQWLGEAGLVNVIVDCTGESCCAKSEGSCACGEQVSAAGTEARVSVFVAAGSKRVAGVRESVQANYGAVAEGKGCGCVGDAAQSSAGSCCSGTSAAIELSGQVRCSGASESAASGSCCAGASAGTPIELVDQSSCCGGSAGGSCCGGTSASNAMDDVIGSVGADDVVWETGYTREQIAAVPAEAAALSLGCGNPTAIASLRPGEVVLDIGSGGGIDAFYAAKRVGPSGRVIGLDMTPSMIERARQSAAEAGLSQVEFRLGQAEEMPVESDTVDVVLSNCVVNLCDDKGRVFEEAYRVLKPGGRLSISDMVSDQPFPLSWRGDAARWAGCVNGALPEQEYLDLVRQAGFTDVQTHRGLSGGEVDGVQVYSLSVSARK